MIESKIVLDSINQNGNRITTYVITYPRWILAEFNTHRMLSRNSASSRAIPTKKMIQALIDNPAMPEYWGKNQSGMQSNEELSQEEIEKCKVEWLLARDEAIKYVNKLLEIGLHKQTANRILEPWAHITTLVTSTEWQNFFALRAHKDAQPEFQKLAFAMLEDYNASTPNELKTGEWHCPFGDNIEGLNQKDRMKVAVARAARVSYTNIEGETSVEKDIELHDRLLASGHCSPFEHAARAMCTDRAYGNFFGWKQYRKFLKNENRSDERVKL